MYTLADVDLPVNKCVWSSLKSISGLGVARAKYITETLGLSPTYYMGSLSYFHFALIGFLVKKYYKVELSLRQTKLSNIRKFTSLRIYRGLRYLGGLPLRGQGTRSNANTAKRLHFRR